MIAGALLCAPATAAAAEKPVVVTGAASEHPTDHGGAERGRDAQGRGDDVLLPVRHVEPVRPRHAGGHRRGAGSGRVKITVAVGGLAPLTTYHYRLVAQNSRAWRAASSARSRPRRQPLGVSLAASPNPGRRRRGTTFSGVLSGTGNADRRGRQEQPVALHAGLPADRQRAGHESPTAASSPVPSVPVNTQFRVEMVGRPDIASTPI